MQGHLLGKDITLCTSCYIRTYIACTFRDPCPEANHTHAQLLYRGVYTVSVLYCVICLFCLHIYLCTLQDTPQKCPSEGTFYRLLLVILQMDFTMTELDQSTVCFHHAHTILHDRTSPMLWRSAAHYSSHTYLLCGAAILQASTRYNGAITAGAEVEVFYSLPFPLPPLMYIPVYYVSMYIVPRIYVFMSSSTLLPSNQLCILTSQCIFNNAFSSTHFSFQVLYMHILRSSLLLILFESVSCQINTYVVTTTLIYFEILCIHTGPVCDNLCLNGGTCDSSGTCVCAAGFTGPTCNTGLCLAP